MVGNAMSARSPKARCRVAEQTNLSLEPVLCLRRAARLVLFLRGGVKLPTGGEPPASCRPWEKPAKPRKSAASWARFGENPKPTVMPIYG